MKDIPIVCRLTEPELRERRTNVLQKALRTVLETREQETGYAYRFPSDSESLDRIFEIVRLERECCAFLRFQVTVEPGGGHVWLELTGPPGTKEMVSAIFDEDDNR